MKFTTSLFLSAAVFCFLGCSETAETSSESTETTETTAPATDASPFTAAPETEQVEGQPMELPAQADNAAPATAPGMNPPHGQPGHRCDIEVGAPLNSAPATATAAAPQPAAPTLTPAPTSQPATAAPGTNPPHGQPGHDCAIPVGAPLNK